MKLRLIMRKNGSNEYILTCPRFENLEARGPTPDAAASELKEKINDYIEKKITRAFTEAGLSLQRMGGVNGKRAILPINFFL